MQFAIFEFFVHACGIGPLTSSIPQEANALKIEEIGAVLEKMFKDLSAASDALMLALLHVPLDAVLTFVGILGAKDKAKPTTKDRAAL